MMRTTLAIDDDVLTMAKAMARHQNKSLGEVVSDLARRSLKQPSQATHKNGILQIPTRTGVVVTTEHVNALRDDLP